MVIMVCIIYKCRNIAHKTCCNAWKAVTVQLSAGNATQTGLKWNLCYNYIFFVYLILYKT